MSNTDRENYIKQLEDAMVDILDGFDLRGFNYFSNLPSYRNGEIWEIYQEIINRKKLKQEDV